MVKRAFGELESQILRILQSGEHKTVKDVHKALGGLDNYNTIMTVMSRLFEKQQLLREKKGLQYHYWLAQTFSPKQLIDKLKQKLMGIETKVLVNCLIDSAEDLSDEELAEMEEMLKKARAKKNNG